MEKLNFITANDTEILYKFKCTKIQANTVKVKQTRHSAEQAISIWVPTLYTHLFH